ncbi:MAG: hypothetical protein KAJ23_07405 [Maribacter sp.]|nr:hypothetical protein [Maribacter sp.]
MEKLFQDIHAVKQRHEAELLAMPHVQGVSIGFTHPESEELIIWLHIESDAPENYLLDRTKIEGHPIGIIRANHKVQMND